MASIGQNGPPSPCEATHATRWSAELLGFLGRELSDEKHSEIILCQISLLLRFFLYICARLSPKELSTRRKNVLTDKKLKLCIGL